MMQHRYSTTDPISLVDVSSIEGKPFLVEGPPNNDLTIYFDNEANLKQYQDIHVECPAKDFSHDIGNNVDEGYDEG